jgi:hypothetical protein
MDRASLSHVEKVKWLDQMFEKGTMLLGLSFFFGGTGV